MSGIAGAIADDGLPLDPGIAARLIAAAPVRGFDGTTCWRDGPVCLMRHHHATTPQAIGETQPLIGNDGRFAIMLDGRIDNRGEIIDLLAREDCRDWTSDVALVLALFERFGEDCVTRLVGDWALAVWRTADRSLFLARSPMGWRPLLWSHANGLFAFSTEPRALLKGLRLDHGPNEGMVGEYLSLRVMTRTETLWRAVQQLESGGAMRIAAGARRLWHWHRVPDPIDERLSDADHIERFNTLFDQAIVSTSRSSTVVSAHLSGGLDSSSIVARGTELQRAGRISRPLQAISARFPGERHDETRWSSAVEERSGIVARVTTTVPFSFDAASRWTAATYQLPLLPNFFDTGVGPLRSMRAEGSRVLLSGHGGDDWLGLGVANFSDLLRQGRFRTLLREGFTRRFDYSMMRRLRWVAFWAIAPQISKRHWQQIAIPHAATGPVPEWIDGQWARRRGLADRFASAQPSARYSSLVQQQRYANFDAPRRLFAASGVLAFAEQHGVEMRYPFYDLRLTRFLMTASPRMIQSLNVRKILLREAMRDTLPEMVRMRLDKAEFSSGIAKVVAERLKARPIEDMLPVRLGWIDKNLARAMRDGILGPGAGIRSLAQLWAIIALDVLITENAMT